MKKAKLLDEANVPKNPPIYLQETLVIITKIADILTDIITENLNQSPNLEHDSDNYFDYFTCKKPPHISILDYLSRILKYSRPESGTVTLSLSFIDKLTKRQNILITNINIHRIILTSLVIAIKCNEDEYYSNSFYAKVGGITLKEFNILEYKYLCSLDFRLYIKEEVFLKYKKHLVGSGEENEEEEEDDSSDE